MSTAADDVIRPLGNGKSLFSASTDGGRSIVPGEGENPATGTKVEEPATSTDGGKPEQPTNISGNATSQSNAEEKDQNCCSELLSQAVSDAELLAIYVSRNGMHVGRDGKAVTPEVLQGVTDARERLVSHTLDGGAAAAFLKNYRELAAAAFPVTVASLRDSTVEQKGALPWWLIFGRKVECIPASVASYTHWAFAGVALFLLILTQSYYIVGTNLIQLLPEYRMLVEKEQSVLKGVEPKSEASSGPQTDLEVRFSKLVDADRTMLCRWLHWCPFFAMPTPNDPGRPANSFVSTDVSHADTDAVVVKSRQMLAVLQGYLLPLLYGWIGATAYVVRSLAREARERLYRRENDTAYTLRIFLGSLAGLAIGWFLKPEDVSGFNAISPFALAFAAGYSVDLLFTLLDKIVNAFSAPHDVPPPKAP
jgi:hypothetical protein